MSDTRVIISPMLHFTDMDENDEPVFEELDTIIASRIIEPGKVYAYQIPLYGDETPRQIELLKSLAVDAVNAQAR